MNQQTFDHEKASSMALASPLVCAEALLEGMAAGVFGCATAKTGSSIVRISDAFTRLTGYTEPEIVGRKLDFLYGSRTDAEVVKKINRSLARRQRFRGELICYRNDGSALWCALVLAPVKLTEEAPGFFAGALIDVSARKLQDDHLKARELTFRGIFENAVEGIYQSTPDGNYLEVNPALARMYGYESPAQLLRQVRNIQQQIYVDPAMRERFKAEIEKTDVVRDFEYQVRRRDGQVIWISESARAVRDTQGRVRYYEGFIEEITGRKQAEAALRTSQDRLIESSRQVGMAEVATGILHNMGNALNSINVSTTLIAEKVSGSRVKAVAKAAALMEANAAELGKFLTTDTKGQQLPNYLGRLGAHLVQEQAELQEEIIRLRKSLEHVGAIVVMQQNYAKGS